MQKTARIWSRPVGVALGSHPDDPPPWSKQFEGTPFLDRAKAHDRSRSCRDVEHAQRRIQDAEEGLEDAKFRAEIAKVEKKLVDWTYSQDGKEKKALSEKLAECRQRSFSDWSDHFKGSPFYKEAMQIEAEDARREVGRRKRGLEEQRKWLGDEENRVKQAEIEAELAVWRLKQMGFSKTASIHLAAHQQASTETTMITEITAEAFFAEMDEIEKHAAAGMVSRKAALAVGIPSAAGLTAAGTAVGHKKGKTKGRREGYHVGSRQGFQMGARRGYTAGQIAVIKRIRQAQAMKARATSSKGSKKK